MAAPLAVGQSQLTTAPVYGGAYLLFYAPAGSSLRPGTTLDFNNRLTVPGGSVALSNEPFVNYHGVGSAEVVRPPDATILSPSYAINEGDSLTLQGRHGQRWGRRHLRLELHQRRQLHPGLRGEPDHLLGRPGGPGPRPARLVHGPPARDQHGL